VQEEVHINEPEDDPVMEGIFEHIHEWHGIIRESMDK